MEKKSPIRQKDIGMTEGYFIEVNCQMCGREDMIAGETKKEVVNKLKDEGWCNLSSDLYMQEGYWCGCDYKD